VITEGRAKSRSESRLGARDGGLTETALHFNLNDNDDMSAMTYRPDANATVAELSITSAPAAVANAIFDATDAQIRQIPREGSPGLEQLACSGESGIKV
jgi:hypothetical protein